jgi:hypothetical protein
MGFSAISPWSNSGVSSGTFKVGAGIYLIVVAMLSSTIGGYVAGRLRTKWTGLHTDEVFSFARRFELRIRNAGGSRRVRERSRRIDQTLFADGHSHAAKGFRTSCMGDKRAFVTYRTNRSTDGRLWRVGSRHVPEN